MDLSDAKWRKASRSGDNGGHCVEVASVPNMMAIRDSKDPHGSMILVGREDFRRFTETLKNI
ncbi:DUF397 domain-containing protein [Actinomadura spongiicola]|uniref:DUF397 domain-containing protein n=1 Tax=Actinomadura spongiicola TaxID=2303421 RepID=A0A372GKS5_9ACTN|nr:DUF397 domain-containing protein [Actinomadura spongiicola]RFS85978.1 DUF397 domain-containing protein [Actinomadura spongiicola]